MDVALRNLTYRRFVDLGRAPLPEELPELGDRADVLAGWRALHDAHALVLDGDSLRMVSPFSAVPTPHRVHAQGRSWYANCAWDAFGILAALQCDGEIATTCPDCGDPLTNGDPSLVFHCLVPASRWWADIVFT